MSNIAIKGAATGTGVFTLESPATNTDRTLVLPDEAGTIDTLQRAGNVLQVVQAETEATVATTSTSFVTTTLTASITPSSASNKVLVLVSAAGLNGVALSAGIYTLFRGTTAGTDLGGASNYGFNLVYANNSVIGGAISINYLDSPSTTSSQTYTFAMRSSGGASISMNSNGQKSTITLMEIAA